MMKILKKYWVGFLALALFVAASLLIYIKLHPKRLPPNLIAGVGHFDGDLVNLNTKYPGRIQKIFVGDGDRVKVGQRVALLGSKEYEEQKRALEAQIEAKKDELKAKMSEYAISKTKVPNILKKAKAALEAKEKQLQELKSVIASQKEVLAQQRRDLKRLQDLYRKKLIQKHKVEELMLKYKTDSNRLRALLAKERSFLK